MARHDRHSRGLKVACGGAHCANPLTWLNPSGVDAEAAATGRIDVAVLQEADGSRWAPPPLEIHTSGLFDTATKYNGTARFTVPAELGSSDRAAITRAALAMYDALGCSGVARIDFFLTDNGLVLNEVNTMPGMTAESQVPRMFAAAGVAYGELVARLIGAATVPTAVPTAVPLADGRPET